MDYELMRLECIKLAYAAGLRGPEAVAEAERMMKFVTVHRRPPFLDDYKPE